MPDRVLSSLPPEERIEVIERTIVDLADLRDAAVREMDDLQYARWRRARQCDGAVA